MTMKTTTQPKTATTAERQTEVRFVAPEVNIRETRDGYVLEADMPGVSRDGLEITLEGNEVTIAGRRNNEAPEGEPLFRERSAADFRRVFDLDPAIDAGKISAKMHQGVLTLTLPKSEQVKPRKIAVND